MIRKDTGAAFIKENPGCLGQFFGAQKGVRFRTGGREPRWIVLSDAAMADLDARQQKVPVRLISHAGRTWWCFRGNVFWEDESRTAEALGAILLEREEQEDRKIDKLRDKHGI